MLVLNAIHEEDFLGFSYGFRPGRGPHDALDALVVGIDSRKVNHVLDADIRSFFDEVPQQWLVRFLSHRIGDPRIIRLIQKWLKAGILEDGIVMTSDKGTGQGSVISPLLANVYLHYVFDLWAARWRRREATGDMIILRYADDTVVGFEHEADARRFWDAMRERQREFSLSLHSDKTRLIEFGRHAGEAWAWQTGNLQLPGFHVHLRQVPQGWLPATQEVPKRPYAGETPGNPGGTATTTSSGNTLTGGVAEAGRQWLLQLPCGADQQSRPHGVPLPRPPALAAHLTAAQRKGRLDLAEDREARCRMAPQAQSPSSMAP